MSITTVARRRWLAAGIGAGVGIGGVSAVWMATYLLVWHDIAAGLTELAVLAGAVLLACFCVPRYKAIVRAERIAGLQRAGYTQEQIAEQLGVTPAVIGRYLGGETK